MAPDRMTFNEDEITAHEVFVGHHVCGEQEWGCAPEFESWMRPGTGEQPTQRLGARTPATGGRRRGLPRPSGRRHGPMQPPIPRARSHRLAGAAAVIANGRQADHPHRGRGLHRAYCWPWQRSSPHRCRRRQRLPASDASSWGRNYLIVGSDGRQGLTKAQAEEVAHRVHRSQRTDTIMIMHVPLFGTPTLVSIHATPGRHSGYGQGKINSAFAYGGPELLTTTVEQTTGLKIDNYVGSDSPGGEHHRRPRRREVVPTRQVQATSTVV